LRRLGFSFCGSGRSLRLGYRRQPLCKLSRRPVRRRTGCRELLFLVSLPCRRVFLVSLSPRPFGSGGGGPNSREPLRHDWGELRAAAAGQDEGQARAQRSIRAGRVRDRRF